ncbi:hypothetical protein Rvan_3155 [Rhodomicrobium vannielii ATCC 17100]|uniref:TIR domain-containing protein n=1 Tax=Rhodomicrobium vannielii (strain ATCC 17100 / DSM 162 / LMG 4299 / NCIMB 10020 / ATH 3.1.1) TaxID=648757 RepID=E3I131_RHOVT|nr:toll/interleukin-1 receptor domain-containing protein [Rhodomicrobium vannielii]ADP72354.1 hypothetical protein Rvan_3155 [Rhodomicrobium vannielii ATCC 17100]
MHGQPGGRCHSTIDFSQADFFISRSGADAAIAERIAHILEDAGYQVILQQWDFGNRNFMQAMHEALASDARVIALLSRDYLESDHCLGEALNKIAHDPLNKKSRLIVMRVANCTPTGLFAALAYWDLVKLTDPALLRDVVLAAVKPGRAKTAHDAASPFLKPPGTVLHDHRRGLPLPPGRLFHRSSSSAHARRAQPRARYP